jgi:hypothetical protein
MGTTAKNNLPTYTVTAEVNARIEFSIKTEGFTKAVDIATSMLLEDFQIKSKDTIEGLVDVLDGDMTITGVQEE